MGKAKPLTEKMKQAIATIKNSLTTEPVLAHPRFDKQFTIATDASISGLGAVLTQRTDDDKEVVIQYISRALRKHEAKYHIYELEVLAMVWAIGVFHQYLFHAPFDVWVDNKTMTWGLEPRKIPQIAGS